MMCRIAVPQVPRFVAYAPAFVPFWFQLRQGTATHKASEMRTLPEQAIATPISELVETDEKLIIVSETRGLLDWKERYYGRRAGGSKSMLGMCMRKSLGAFQDLAGPKT